MPMAYGLLVVATMVSTTQSLGSQQLKEIQPLKKQILNARNK
jgi:hypothetical protein